MLRVISKAATQKEQSSKNLQIFQKTRSSHWNCSVKLSVLNFVNKVANLSPATLLKRNSSTDVFL